MDRTDCNMIPRPRPLSQLQAAIKEVVSRDSEANELRLIIGQFEGFAGRVREGLDSGDFATRREIIRTPIKRVELDEETVRIVYKVNLPRFLPESGFLRSKAMA